MKALKFALPIVIILVGYSGMRLIEASAEEATEKALVDVRPTVTVAQLAATDYQATINAYGAVAPLESTRLAAQVAGEVAYWNPSLVSGGIVRRGDVLFKIEQDDYQAALLQAEANLASAQSQLIQEQALADVAKEEAKRLKSTQVSDLYLRKPQVLSAQAAVKSAQAQLKIAQRDLANCEITAPYDALVVSRSVGTGDYLSRGAIAAVINNIEYAEVTFPVPGFDMQFLPDSFDDLTVDIHLQGQSGVARVADLHRDSGIIDEATRMTHLVARITDPYALHSEDKVVKFGSYVALSFKGKVLNNVYLVNQNLVTQGKVWLLDNEDKMHAQPVTVLREEGTVFVISADFRSEKMVVNVPEYPQEGMEVKVVQNNNDLVALSR